MWQKVTETNLLCDKRTYILLQIVNKKFLIWNGETLWYRFEAFTSMETPIRVLLLRIYYNICLDIIVYHHSGIDRKLRHYILIRCAKNQKTKNKAPIFYAIRSLAVSDFIFLVLSMIPWIFILTKVNNTVLYFTTGIIVTFSLIDFTFNVYPWKCSINPHLFKDEKTSINDCEPCQYQEDVLVYL